MEDLVQETGEYKPFGASIIYELTLVSNKKKLTGIIDLVAPKYFVFYDLTGNNDPDTRMAIVLWQTYFQTMRFSVFKEIHCPTMKIGNPRLLKKKDVTSDKPLPGITKLTRCSSRVYAT